MKYAIISTHDSNYREFVKTTLYSNHKEYCDRHGYDLIVEEVDYSELRGFIQWKVILDNLTKYDWIWFVGCDTLVMNHTIKIEDKIDNSHHFIVSDDVNGPNAHSCLIRNSPEALEWINFIWNMRLTSYIHHDWADNKVLMDYYHQQPWSNIISVKPQRYMNSYLYQEIWGHTDESLLRACITGYIKHDMNFNLNYGQFQKGDWLLHMPGTGLETRMQIVQNWNDKVIK